MCFCSLSITAIQTCPVTQSSTKLSPTTSSSCQCRHLCHSSQLGLILVLCLTCLQDSRQRGDASHGAGEQAQGATGSIDGATTVASSGATATGGSSVICGADCEQRIELSAVEAFEDTIDTCTDIAW